MAKLEGVKVLDMQDGEVTKIEYEGEVYTKVDGGAGNFKDGDIALNKIDALDANAGNYYKVIYHEFFGSETLTVLDDANEVHSDILYQSDIFRKAEQTERKPKPGDKIRIINAHEITGGEYKNGDILTVKEYHPHRILEHVKVEEHDVAIYLSEFEFVDDSEFKAGDFAKVVGDTHFGDTKKGTVVKICGEADYAGDIRFETLNGDDYDYAKAESLEKVNPTDRELSFLRAGRKVGEFKKGDIVRVLSEHHTGSRNLPGDIGEVVGKDFSGYDVNVEARNENISNGNHHVPENLELIAPAESRTDIGEKSYA